MELHRLNRVLCSGARDTHVPVLHKEVRNTRINVTRLGIILLLVGLILLTNAASEHVPQSAIWGYGEVNVNETKSYILMTAPVGVGNITVGYSRAPNSNTPTGDGAPPAGLFPDSYVLPIHFEVKDPANQTLVEEDLVTPGSFEVDFKTRGKYMVYITNHGNETSPMPIGVSFEEGKPENREADKYLLSITLTIAGAALLVTGVVMKLVSKQRRQNLA